MEQLLDNLQEFKRIIERQQDEINSLKQVHSVQSRSKPDQSQAGREPKVASPEFFSGNRKKARFFLLQLKNVFLAQPERFSSDNNRVAYAISFLRDVAFEWISPYLETNSMMLTSFEAFEEAFNIAFSDVDRRRNSEKELLSLKQGKRPVSALVSEFQRLAFETKMNADALFPLFYQTLNEDVKDELCKCERPETIDEYYRLAIRIDDRLFERRKEKRLNLPPTFQRTFLSRPSPTPSESTAMIVDNVQRRGPLSKSEKERRIKEDLCMYCGAKDHKVLTCPVKPNKQVNSKARV